MSVPLVPFYDGNQQWLTGTWTSADGIVRSVRHIAQPPLTVEMQGFVGITVQAGTGFRSTRRSSRHYHADAAHPGRTFVDRPGERWSLAVDGECRVLQFRQPSDVFEAIMLEDHDDPRGAAAVGVVHGTIDLDLLGLLARALLAAEELRSLAVRAVIARVALTHGTGQKMRTRGLSPATLRRVMDLVESDLANVTLGAMSTEAGLSVYHFAREFRRETGQTPWSYVIRRRVWCAAAQLAQRNRSIGQVAMAVGFVDASHMGRAFRSVLGVSPKSVGDCLLP